MFKKIISVFLSLIIISFNIPTMAMTIQYDGKTELYKGSFFDLRVNGKEIKMPLAPLIFNDRALVPVREVFEALNAKVDYTETTKCVDVTYYGNTVSIYINKATAYINDKKTTIPDNAVPKLINEVGKSAKTMVPVRFISESLNMDVKFENNTIYISNGDEETGTAGTATYVTPSPSSAPTPSQTPTSTKNPTTTTSSASLNSITYETTNSTTVIKAKLSGTSPSVDSFILANPTRLVVDFTPCKKNNGKDSYQVSNGGIDKIRVGHENQRTRLVIDASVISSAKVYAEGDTVTITVSTDGNQTSKVDITNNFSVQSKPVATATPKPTATAKPTTTAKPTATKKPTTTTTSKDITNIPYTVHSPKDKLIVIDAGHGGSDSGAVGGTDDDPVYEKDLTLSIATKVYNYLTQKGYNAVMTRYTDEYPTLTARAEYANNSNTAIFVSIHINSVANAPEASGTEVYYSDINNTDFYGVKSSVLANNIYKNMISALGSKQRGVKTANHMVTRTALMPASLVEVGFISNEDELNNMQTNSYQTLTAKAIAEGIITTLGKVTVPSDLTEAKKDRAEAIKQWEETK